MLVATRPNQRAMGNVFFSQMATSPFPFRLGRFFFLFFLGRFAGFCLLTLFLILLARWSSRTRPANAVVLAEKVFFWGFFFFWFSPTTDRNEPERRVREKKKKKKKKTKKKIRRQQPPSPTFFLFWRKSLWFSLAKIRYKIDPIDKIWSIFKIGNPLSTRRKVFFFAAGRWKHEK